MIRFFIALARVYALMFGLLVESILVIARLKVLPPTGDAVWRWRLR